MNSIKKTLLLFISLLAFTNVVNAQKTDGDIKHLMIERDAEIKDLLGPKGSEYTPEQREKLKEIINGIIDFEAMAKTALAETYDTLNADKKDEFVELFSSIVRDHSLNKLDIYRADVTYQNISINGDSSYVETLAELDDVRTPVNYAMRFTGNEWVITDMTIDDVSTAESYNRQFQKIIKKKGFDSLMENLRKRASRT